MQKTHVVFLEKKGTRNVCTQQLATSEPMLYRILKEEM